MKTVIKSLNENNIKRDVVVQAGNFLKQGKLVAFPTETVYGLGANALDDNAAKQIYKAKGRPSDNPLIVHISNKNQLNDLVVNVSEKAQLLMDKFWPGPLTLIFKKKECVPNGTTGGLDTVAIRMPNNRIALSIIEESGLPIAAPSANISGKPSPTIGEHVVTDLNNKVDMIIDGGTVTLGLESTVVDMTEDIPIILRPGFVTKVMIEEVIGTVKEDATLYEKKEKLIPKSPGMKYRHYAPKGELKIVDGELNDIVKKINSLVEKKQDEGYKVGVIATSQTKNLYDNGIIVNIGNRENEEEIANNLFRILREFDKIGVEYIFVESLKCNHLGQAIMNRLLKAAGYNIIRVDYHKSGDNYNE